MKKLLLILSLILLASPAFAACTEEDIQAANELKKAEEDKAILQEQMANLQVQQDDVEAKIEELKSK